MTYRLRDPMPPEIAELFAGYPPLLASLLYARGIDTLEAAQYFLEPDYDLHLHDPMLLADMEKSVTRISAAIDAGEPIVIYSDYDADGIPGAVLLGDAFKKIGYAGVSNYIPHRTREGFGLNTAAIDEIAAGGAHLIITIDCGITDIEPVAHAQSLGVDVIVTDHHLPGFELPPAYAVINPKRADCAYPDKHLCGAGVAFKLAQALLRARESAALGWEKWLLDMAGLATLADRVPLAGENRVIAYYGMLVLRKSRRPGLQQLLRKLRINQRTLTEDDLGFMIVPRINAASRMGHPIDALKLLSTDDPVEAGVLAGHLDRINTERKSAVAVMVKEAKRRIAQLGEVREVIVMGNVEWRPSLLGLVASSLADEYHRPVFLWGRDDAAHIKGSCRSDGVINLVALMQGAGEGLFLDAGGHALSGGFSMETAKVHELEAALIAAYHAHAHEIALAPERVVDAELSLNEVNESTCRTLERLAPFGEGNPKPQFLLRRVPVTEVRAFGKRSEHMTVVLGDASATVPAVAFFATPESFTRTPEAGSAVDLIACVERSAFNGRNEIRLRIIDIL